MRPAPTSRRPTLYGTRQAVSSGHYLATAAGQAILDAGGNAIDAGCATGIALAVLHSSEVNFAGVAPIMIRTAAGEVVTIDGLGTWPASLPADHFMREHDGELAEGVCCTVVPAAPDAWITVLRDHGTMSFGEVAAEAIRLAREGFAMFEYFNWEVTTYRSEYERWPSNAAIYLPDGGPPALNTRFVQSDLADTIERMADAERAAAARGREAGLAAARDLFYKGEIAAEIAEYHREQGGFLSRDDLASFTVRYEPVVRARWRDFELFTCGPWCQGPTLAQALLMLERGGLAYEDQFDPDYVHLALEVMKAVFADREYRYGDPRFVDVGLEELLSADHLDRRLAGISSRRAHPDLPDPIGAPAGARDLLPPIKRQSKVQDDAPHPDTSYVCVIDRDGNAFSATPSDGSYEAPVVPGLGIVASARGTQSRPDPRHPAGVAPGKRPRLTPNPAMAVRDDGSVLAFGCPGGDMQIQAMLQVFLNIFHFGMDVQPAIDAPRFSTWSFPASFAPFDFLANRVEIEGRFPQAVFEDLAERGHDVRRWPDFTRTAAAVEAIYADATTGFLRAGADPRQPAYAIVS